MKKTYVLLFLVAIYLSACNKSPLVINISQEQIQKGLDKKFPYQKNALLAKLELTDPKVSLSENKIFIDVSFEGTALKKSVKGQVSIVTRVAYKQDKKAFYLKDFDILKLDVGNASAIEKKKLTGTLEKGLAAYLASFPVYKLKEKDYKQNIASMLLKDIKTKGDQLVVTLGF